MARRTSLVHLGSKLESDLAHAYEHGAESVGGHALVEAYAAFGTATAATGVSLEDAMSVGTSTLQDLFERTGGGGSNPGTMTIAGAALASLARAYVAIDGSPASRPTEDAPVPTQLVRLAALHQINRAVTANLKLSEMLETIVTVVSDTTTSDACSVFLYDEASGLLVLRAAVGFAPASVNAVTIRIGTGITGRAALEGHLIAASDAHEHESFHAHPGLGDELYTSQVSVPILLQGHVRMVGILNINSIKRREFDQDELEFLQTVAGELAISIENARQYSSTDERLRQKVTELGTLQRVSRTLTSTLDLPGVLRLICEQAIELLHAEAAVVYRVPPHIEGNPPEIGTMVEHRVGSARELGDVASHDAIVRSAIRSGTVSRGDVTFVDGVARLVCWPLRTARETVGTLCFQLRQSTLLDQDTVALLQAFSDSAAMAIENAQLYQDAMHSIQTQSALVQEMHHRVRNNLQTVAALLSLQLRTAEDAPWATEIREAISRIQSIAAVHDLLSDEERLAGTTLDVIARLVAEDAHSTLIPPGLTVQFVIEPSDLVIPTKQATIISLLINELAANAISHGFRDRKDGFVRIRGWESAGFAHIEIFNNGQGVPEGFNPANSTGLGMRITQRLVTSDLKGTFQIASDDAGTTALMRFPVSQPAVD